MKRFFALLICIPFIFWLLAACSVQAPDTSQINVLQTGVAELRDENMQVKETLDQLMAVQNATIEVVASPTIEITPTFKSKPTKTTEKKIRELNIDETVTITDYCEFTLEQVEFSKKVMPFNASGYYNFYEAKDPETTFLHIVVRYKNLDNTDKLADSFGSMEAIYNEKYEYTSFSIIEKENRSDFAFSNITSIKPLSTGFIHYLANVPEEVESSGSPILIKLTVNGEVFQYQVQ